MSLASLFFILLSIALTSSAQLLMKAGMSSARIDQAVADGGLINIFVAVALSPLVIAGLLSFGLSAGSWLFVLRRMDVSQAYPFIALGIAATAVGGFFLFGETLSLLRVAGVICIGVGVILVAVS